MRSEAVPEPGAAVREWSVRRRTEQDTKVESRADPGDESGFTADTPRLLKGFFTDLH